MESHLQTSYWRAFAMFAIYVTVYEIFAVEICMTLTFTIGQGQIQISQSKANVRLYI